MFKQARLKLTLWYLLIIMAVSVFFSLVIHNVLMRQVIGMANDQRFRIERRFGLAPRIESLDEDFINDANTKINMTLLGINGIIFISAGALGYFLAGKTLQPIQEMLEDQKRFITDSSHELRTPLTSLKSAIEVSLRDKNLKLKDAKLTLAENLEDVNKLQSLSESLLRLSSQRTFQDSEKRKIDLKQVIAQALKNTSKIAKNKQISLKNNLNKSHKIIGNQAELSELFTILLDNAIKYSNSGSQIEISAVKKSRSVQVTVKDQGVGISSSDIKHIFDRFYRSDVARSKKDASGFGLGLSIAKKIVDDHHGEISVKSTMEKGSAFTVTLPV